MSWQTIKVSILLPIAGFVLIVMLANELRDTRLASAVSDPTVHEMSVTLHVDQIIFSEVFGRIEALNMDVRFSATLPLLQNFEEGSVHRVVLTGLAGDNVMLLDQYVAFQDAPWVMGGRLSSALATYILLSAALAVYAVYAYVNMHMWDREMVGAGGSSPAAFDALVRRLERKAKAHPRWYLAKLVALGVLGYAFVPLILAGMTGAVLLITFFSVNIPGFDGLWLALPLLLFAGYMVHAFWVRLEPPHGHLITIEHSPRLFDMLRDIRREIGGPPIHLVLIDSRFNAGIVQIPRLGLYFWPKNYLVLGLPLLESLGEDEVRAVVAHEYGHLVGKHGRVSSWIYQLNQTWRQLKSILDRNVHWSNALVRRFLDRFQPYFAAYSFVHNRDNEFFADALAAGVVGTDTVANALCRTEVDAWINEKLFWPAFNDEAFDHESPPALPYTMLPEFFAKSELGAPRARALEDAMGHETNNFDTHPALSKRLEVLGFDCPDALPTASPAAPILLGDGYQMMVTSLNEDWCESGLPLWLEYQSKIAEERARLEELSEMRPNTPLGAAELEELASLTLRLVGQAEALAIFSEVLLNHPTSPLANYCVGMARLNNGDEAGLDNLKIATNDHNLTFDACTEAINWLEREGVLKELNWFQDCLSRHNQMVDRASAERSGMRRTDSLIAHQLGGKEVQSICATLAKYPRVSRAYLAQKDVKHMADHPFNVLVVEGLKRRDIRLGSRNLLYRLADDVASTRVGHLVALDHGYSYLKPKLARLKNALVYERK